MDRGSQTYRGDLLISDNYICSRRCGYQEKVQINTDPLDPRNLSPLEAELYDRMAEEGDLGGIAEMQKRMLSETKR